MERITVHLDNPQKRVIEQTVEVLNRGGVVLLPGDTAYFLAIGIGKKNALEKLNRIKQNKKRKYYSVVFRDLSEIANYTNIDNRHFNLLKRCFPGPYTFIVSASKDIPKIMLQKRKEIGIRVPESIFINELINAYEAPLVVSTASNADGEEFNDPDEDEPTWLGHVDLVVESGYIYPELTTIVKLDDDEYEIVREGKGDPDIF